jgi:hypothetical protein
VCFPVFDDCIVQKDNWQRMSTECRVCNKPVYFAEQVVFHGIKYHKLCFKCTSCARLLNTGDAFENNDLPYCQGCYNRDFGAKNLTNTGNKPLGESQRASIDTRGRDLKDPLLEREKTKPQMLAKKIDKTSPAAKQIALNQQRAAAHEREFEMEDEEWDPDADSDDDNRFSFAASASFDVNKLAGAKGKKYQAKNMKVGGGESCKKCNKSVGFADKIQYLGASYHKTCFRCTECDKTIANVGEAVEVQGKPYHGSTCAKASGLTVGYKN